MKTISELKHDDMTKLTVLKGDYKDVDILPDSVIYCDIPYKGVKDYSNIDFDYEAFYDWCEQQTQLVIISEYDMPKDRFTCISENPIRKTFCATSNNHQSVEKLFIPTKQVELYNSMKNRGS